MNYKDELWSRHAVLAVIMGIRAGEMHCLDYIDLPEGEAGEEEVAAFCMETVMKYLDDKAMAMDKEDDGLNFDEFIETALEKEYGTEDW